MSGISVLTRALLAAAGAGLVFAPIAAEAAPNSRTRTVPITLPLSYAATPLPAWSVADETAHEHRWRRYRYDRARIDGGDILAGILVIGGVAAIASAIDKSGKDRRDRERSGDYRYDPRSSNYGDRERRDDDYGRDDRSGSYSPGEADRAVNACLAEAGRSGRVDEVFDVSKRDGEWRVEGDYTDGESFNCTFGRDGRAFVGKGSRSSALDAPARNDDDGRYATARSPDFEDGRSR